MVKKPINRTIDGELKEQFDKICEKMAINQSKWIENKIREFVEDNKHLLEDKE